MSAMTSDRGAVGDTDGDRPLTRRELRELSAVESTTRPSGAERAPFAIAPWNPGPLASVPVPPPISSSAQPPVRWVIPVLVDDDDPMDDGDGIPTQRPSTAVERTAPSAAPRGSRGPAPVGLVPAAAREVHLPGGGATAPRIPAPRPPAPPADFGPAAPPADFRPSAPPVGSRPNAPIAAPAGATRSFLPAAPGAPLLTAPVVVGRAGHDASSGWASSPAFALPGAYPERNGSGRTALVTLVGLVLVAAIAAASVQYFGIVDVLGIVGL